MSDDKKKELKLQMWITHQERALTNKWYAIARIDLLIVSISAGGIYIVFEALKFVTESKIDAITWPLKVAGLLFTIAIILNFIGQIFGARANGNEAILAKHEIGRCSDELVDDVEIGRLEERIDFQNLMIRRIDGIATGAMLIGIAFLIVFVFTF